MSDAESEGVVGSTGFLVPDWYVTYFPSEDDLLIASIIWGFSLAAGMFSANKAYTQTIAQWRRSGRIKPYAIMIWAEWASSTTIGVVSWLFLRGYIKPSFQYFFLLLCLWVVQMQCIPGIIINRIALLMINKRDVSRMRWATAAAIGLINVSVFVIWIPAHLQISPTWVKINDVWDRVEKGIFAVIDAGLHGYFIYLIRVKLIQNGLQKYMPLYRFNLFMVVISISLDLVLIGSMSIGNGFVYVQFHPLVYILKLHIEMNISGLIVKVVRATGGGSSYDDYQHGTELKTNPKNNNTQGRSGGGVISGSQPEGMDPFQNNNNEVRVEADGNTGDKKPGRGITKIVQTRVTVSSRNRSGDLDGDDSSQSSTRQLKNDSQAYQF